MTPKARIAISKSVFSILAAGILTVCLPKVSAVAGTVQQIQNFGTNTSGIQMYLYTPTNVAAKPAILVGIHACHSPATSVCSANSGFALQADKYGFLLVCPGAVSTDQCWDVHSAADLSHTGLGNASDIISMVNYVVQNKNGDPNRVYAAGHSSGGMMTNVMLGSYPDVFKAGAAFAGVAFGCYAVGPVDSLGWNSGCANGNVTKTAMQWGDTVRAAYPGFNGTRPRMQLWHGTVDAIVNFKNFAEEIKEWTNVLGVSETPTTTETNALMSTWIRTRYVDSSGVVQVEAIQETGQPHNLVVNVAEAVHFFGLDGSNPAPDGGAPDTRMGTGGTMGGSGGASGGRNGAGGSNAVGGKGGGNSGGAVGSGGSSTNGSGGSPIVDAGTSGTGGTSGPSGSGGLPDTGSGGGPLLGSGGTTTPAGTGGSTSGSGGITAGQDGGATGGSTGMVNGPSSGCSCDTGASNAHAGRWSIGWLLISVGLAGIARRRRGR